MGSHCLVGTERQSGKVKRSLRRMVKTVVQQCEGVNATELFT